VEDKGGASKQISYFCSEEKGGMGGGERGVGEGSIGNAPKNTPTRANRSCGAKISCITKDSVNAEKERKRSYLVESRKTRQRILKQG